MEIWKNRWTYGKYGRTGGHMEDMKDRWTFGRHERMGQYTDHREGQVDIQIISKDGHFEV